MIKLYIYTAVLLALMGFTYWYSKHEYQAGYNACEAIYQKKINAQYQESEKKIADLQGKVNEITTKWLEEKNKKPIPIKETIREVPKYVKDIRLCDLNRGAVSLLNNSADPFGLQKSFHPPLTFAEAQAPSTISQRAQIERCAEWADQYVDTADQLSRLIDVLHKIGY